MSTKVLDYNERTHTDKRIYRDGETPPVIKEHSYVDLNIYSEGIRSRKKPKPLTSTPFKFYSYKESFAEGTCSWILYNTTLCMHNGAAVTRIRQTSDNGSLALMRAERKVSDFNFGETLVEFKDTWKMIEGSLNDLSSFFSDIKKGNFNKRGIKGVLAKSLGKIPPTQRLAKGWLSVNFGWLPLIGDIYNVVEAYGQKSLVHGESLRRRSGARPKILKGSGVPYGTLDYYDPSASLEASANFRGQVANSNIANLNRLGLANPLLMAWNYLPFSFLFDWFLPISTILGSLTSDFGLRSVDRCITTRTMITDKVRFSDTCHDFGKGNIKSQTYTALRKPVDSAPPLIDFHPDINFGLWRVATAVSLVRTVLLGKKVRVF